MKNMYKILTVLLCALGLLLPNACTKNYADLNKDPKIITPEVINVGLLLTNVEWNGVVGNGSYGNGTYGCFCGMCKRDDDAPFNEQDAPGMWNFSYETMINNLSNIIQVIDGRINKDELVNKQAIARILKAWAVANLTDTYGDVPYSESCLPLLKAIYNPKYDTQQSIYTDLLKL